MLVFGKTEPKESGGIRREEEAISVEQIVAVMKHAEAGVPVA
jgi:hypothetical protein